MTESELIAAREMLARKQVGWDYLKAERIARIRSTVTSEALPSFQSAFAYSLTLPPRMDTGFIEFYKALGRGRNKCST